MGVYEQAAIGRAFDLRYFVDEHNRSAKRVGKRVGDFLESPRENDIHGVRIAIRKARVSTSLLPRRIRKSKGCKRYTRSAKKFFSLSSRLRDADIIRSKLRSYPGPETRRVWRKVKKERLRKLQAAEKRALHLVGLRGPKMRAGSLDESKLAARFERQRERLLASIRVSFQTVRRDESDVDELHVLRKSMKQLRYLLELVPADRATEELLDRLHGWQDELGEIHDHDMFLSLLREQPPSRLLLQVIGSESSKRRQRYHAFLESYIDSQPQDSPIVAAREDRTEPRAST